MGSALPIYNMDGVLRKAIASAALFFCLLTHAQKQYLYTCDKNIVGDMLMAAVFYYICRIL